ncbi:MAG: helix-turn-helix domain-containing protein [Candidatus Dormibacteria bacterium]
MLRAATTIREARDRAGVTQAQLASRLGTSQAAVWRWERGLVEPSWATVLRAVAACGMAVAGRLETVDPDDWRLVEAGRNRTPAQRLHDLESYSRFVTAGRRALRRRRHGG